MIVYVCIYIYIHIYIHICVSIITCMYMIVCVLHVLDHPFRWLSALSPFCGQLPSGTAVVQETSDVVGSLTGEQNQAHHLQDMALVTGMDKDLLGEKQRHFR